MKLYDSGFIGFDDASTIREWSGGDVQEKFRTHCETLPDTWYYRNASITYNINENGHRSKKLSELNLDNYLLFLGCSITEGVGLEQSKTYAAVLSKKLGCDYYNMGLGATGIDVITHNLMIWFATIPKKPKAVVIQWPDFTRNLTGSSVENLETRGMWQNNEDYNRFVDLGISLEFFSAKKLLTRNLIKRIITVPTVEFGLNNIIPLHDDVLSIKRIDLARDLGHPGIKSNENFAEVLYDHLINTECLNFYQNIEPRN